MRLGQWLRVWLTRGVWLWLGAWTVDTAPQAKPEQDGGSGSGDEVDGGTPRPGPGDHTRDGGEPDPSDHAGKDGGSAVGPDASPDATVPDDAGDSGPGPSQPD